MSVYVANIQVSKTFTKKVEKQAGRRGFEEPTEEKVTESFRVTVKAQSLELLKTKVKAHMDLIDTDDLRGEA